MNLCLMCKNPILSGQYIVTTMYGMAVSDETISQEELIDFYHSGCYLLDAREAIKERKKK